ncbi:diacylglycerol/lipid kinase family protein [Chloroflexota bacterium]
MVEASKVMPNYFGRNMNCLPYVLGGLGSLFSYKNKRIFLRVEDEAEHACDCAMMVIANRNYFGGGMCIALDARPDDGLLDMIVFGDMRKSEIMKILPMTYQGRHINHNKVRLQKIKNIAIRCAERILVEADGELLGEGSAICFEDSGVDRDKSGETYGGI